MPRTSAEHTHPCCAGCCDICSSRDSQPAWPYDSTPIEDDDLDEDDEDDRPSYDRERVIQYHGYRPEPLRFHGEGPVYLGMELEVHVSLAERYYRPGDRYFRDYDSAMERYARKVQTDLGDVVYLQEDGSVSDGFEITSHPMSYAWAMESFPWEALRTMASDGCWTDRHVGLHVHVSRAAFKSECHLYRWMKFVHRNAEQVMTLARRRDSRWAPFRPEHRMAAKHYIKGPSRGPAGYQYDHRTGRESYVDWDRYQAINPVNSDTLEVRVFASSLDPSEVQAALAFVAGSVEYTRDLDASKIIKERGWAWSTFVEWLRSRDEYRVLLEVLGALSCVS